MVHGIHDFYATVTKHQLLRDFNFRLQLINTNALVFNTTDEIVYAHAGTLPGRKITDHTAPFMGMDLHFGGSVQYPGSEGYKITLLMDASSALREKLERASRTIFNDKSSTGDYRMPGTDQTLVLSVVDSKLKTIVNYTLVGVQVRDIGDITFDYWKGTGDTVSCEITVAFQYYTSSSGSSDIVVAK